MHDYRHSATFAGVAESGPLEGAEAFDLVPPLYSRDVTDYFDRVYVTVDDVPDENDPDVSTKETAVYGLAGTIEGQLAAIRLGGYVGGAEPAQALRLMGYACDC
ncbi:hypothetical protein KDJ57_gp56 [Gordonia phage Catfish]|uniref:Uncharacterized protein n=1 Tax=Gordonia phage Catfish TaxID=2301538 RepID=A0A385D1F8_9CAUD|nr:hypothetical protein KDJ57_gp56 [Gordonia phage Catfish]AXQ51889.1 hypothetical protein SEA_CATFISH_53 [Gordonia phage Catfish]